MWTNVDSDKISKWQMIGTMAAKLHVNAGEISKYEKKWNLNAFCDPKGLKNRSMRSAEYLTETKVNIWSEKHNP